MQMRQHMRTLSPCLARMDQLMMQLSKTSILAPCHLAGEPSAGACALMLSYFCDGDPHVLDVSACHKVFA